MRKVLNFQPYYCRVVIILFALFVCLIASAYAADYTFQWDTNTESDLTGYRLNYKTDSSGPPYNGTGANEGDSPIDVGNVAEYEITGLDDTKIYHFALTAYNISGYESNYSNEVSTDGGGGDGGGGDGGGGGGCFIASAAFGSRFEKHVKILRQFRDVYIMPYGIGRIFLSAYYKYSPYVVEYIADNDTARKVMRWCLLPIIGLSWMVLHLGVTLSLALLSMMSVIMLVFYRKIIGNWGRW
jgi:hypothetical protein